MSDEERLEVFAIGVYLALCSPHLSDRELREVIEKRWRELNDFAKSRGGRKA